LADPAAEPATDTAREMFQFKGYTLDVARGCLRTADREVELRPKSFEVLRYLVESGGRLVTKDEIIKSVWPNVVVTDESLAQCISEVRHAIGDGGQAIIKTVPRRGYRFVAPVSQSNAVPEAAPQMVGVPTGGHARRGSGVDAQVEPPLPDKPSIAVLPFTNIGGDPEQEYFADGMVEEIITALSRFSGLLVIARNSSFAYKGRCVDAKQVGRELGVRYVLEGSVRKAANRLRITGQLIDTSSGAHIWADRFDGALKSVFNLQDEVTTSVVGAMSPKIEQAEIQRAKRKPTASLDAYDYFLHGMATDHDWTREANNKALRLFYKAIEIDPGFASAHGMAAWCYNVRKAYRWMVDQAEETAEGSRLARTAVSLGKDDAVALSRGGWVLAYVARDLDAGSVFIERALALNPNLAFTWLAVGFLKVWLGEPETALQHLAHAIRLSPFDSMMPLIQVAIAFANFFIGDYDKASCVAEHVLREKPDYSVALRYAAASNALAGRMKEAQYAIARLREIDPELRVANLHDMAPLRRPEDRARYEDGMRRAGLPE
jgi:TolB-like protein/DNA-binding winged helix-turn-helix (wHTH) protein